MNDTERLEQIRKRVDDAEKRWAATYADSLRHSPQFMQMAVHEAEIPLLKHAREDVPFLLSALDAAEQRAAMAERTAKELLGEVRRETIPCPDKKPGCAVHHFRFVDWKAKCGELQEQATTTQHLLGRHIERAEQAEDALATERARAERAEAQTEKAFNTARMHADNAAERARERDEVRDRLDRLGRDWRTHTEKLEAENADLRARCERMREAWAFSKKKVTHVWSELEMWRGDAIDLFDAMDAMDRAFGDDAQKEGER